MPSTPLLKLPYPNPSDGPDGAGQIYNLAVRIEAVLGGDWNDYSPGYQNINFTFSLAQWRIRLGKVTVRIAGTVTGTSNSSGNFLLAAPTPTAGNLCTGTAVLMRGATRYRIAPEIYSAGLIQFFYGAPESPVTATSPAGWANGDKFYASFEYDLA